MTEIESLTVSQGVKVITIKYLKWPDVKLFLADFSLLEPQWDISQCQNHQTDSLPMFLPSKMAAVKNYCSYLKIK